MKYIENFAGGFTASRIALGCMRITTMTSRQADAHIINALEQGINIFDHADIYGGGRCETVFGGVLKRNPELRDKMIIQTKCGIRKGMYDFSKEHIISSVEGSMKRLNVEHIDILLLHRPDLLMDPDEVAAAFDELQRSGKVGSFGVSNHSPMQIELLQKSCDQKLYINQVQLSIPHAYLVSSGANVNMTNADGTIHDGYLRDYCRLNDITVQPWSPLQHGFFGGAFIKSYKYKTLNLLLKKIGDKYDVSASGIAIAWLLRLPEKMQPVIGSTNIKHVSEICEAADVDMSAEDWYKIYKAAGYELP